MSIFFHFRGPRHSTQDCGGRKDLKSSASWGARWLVPSGFLSELRLYYSEFHLVMCKVTKSAVYLETVVNIGVIPVQF